MQKCLVPVVIGLAIIVQGCSNTPTPSVEAQGLETRDAPWGLTYGVVVSIAPCVSHRTLDGEGAPVGALIATGVGVATDAVGAALKAAADEKTVFMLGQRPVQLAADLPVLTCLQVARGAHFTNPPPSVVDDVFRARQQAAGWNAGGLLPESWQRDLWVDSELWLADHPDFFFEGALITDAASGFAAVHPLFAALQAPQPNGTLNWTGRRHTAVFFGVDRAGESASVTAQGGSVALPLGPLVPGRGHCFNIERLPIDPGTDDQVIEIFSDVCAVDGRIDDPIRRVSAPPLAPTSPIVRYPHYQSPWVALTLPATPDPFMLRAMVTETREANAFIGFLSSVFEEIDDTLETELVNRLDPEKRTLAAETQMTADDEATTGTETKIVAALEKVAACQEVSDSDSGAVPLLAAEARKALIDLNASLRAAGRRGDQISRSEVIDKINLGAAPAEVRDACAKTRTAVLGVVG